MKITQQSSVIKAQGFQKKINYCLLFVFLFQSLITQSQDINFCGQQEITTSWWQKYPEYKTSYQQLQNERANFVNIPKGKAGRADSILYTIPVVFHILHLDGIENISDEQILDQVAILNRDYQKQNADTAIIDSHFISNIANVGFAFKLAAIDPNGNCTNGIVRHYTSKTFWDANNLNDFIYSWPTDKYLNIYVVSKLNINATAYAFLPGIGIPDYADVIVCTHRMVGSIGTASVSNSRVLTHEVAHWFDIHHIWGTSNAPGVACGDDLVNDTPETKGFSTCNIANSNVCNPAVFENVQNYMDYSPCKIMFTNGQANRMYATIASGINNRNNVFTLQNQLETGMLGSLPCTTKADFYGARTKNCKGNSLTFTSISQFGNTTGSLLWNFPGGTPSSSSDSIVTITYPNPGTYSVSLTATGVNGANTETKNNWVQIVDNRDGFTIPYFENFERDDLPTELIIVNEEQDTINWKHNLDVGANNTGRSIYLNNFPDSTNYDHTDWFETPYFDFSATTNVSLSFFYAYAKRYTNQADSFKVQYSLDCGGSWVHLSNIPNTNVMAGNSGGVNPSLFTPSASSWKKVTVPATKLQALNNQPSVKFRFFFKTDFYVDGANNIYLDEINLTGDVILSVLESDILTTASVYPNPSNADFILEFFSSETKDVALELTDITGRVFDKATLNVHAGDTKKYLINPKRSLNPGIYMLSLCADNKKVVKKVILTGR